MSMLGRQKYGKMLLLSVSNLDDIINITEDLTIFIGRIVKLGLINKQLMMWYII